ncbi:MAG: hypothetical protein CSH49_06325 [Alcanivorax sp.]|nr:hypothetical protein [Pseudomonadales bacterium]MCK5791594.1 hypothetical protein [Ketobacter sp.]TNC89635.1 MAG: hypothetical protein CSH49_06325 [Alcanivorax sp.]
MYIGKTLPERPIPFEQFDPDYLANFVRDNILPKCVTERQKLICQNFVDHASAECKGDYETLMASCSQRRQDYRRWGKGDDGLMEGIQPQSYDELCVFYGNLVTFNLFVIHLELEKFIVGEDTLVLEGNVHQMYPGAMLPVAFGIEPDDEDAVYMLTIRMALFFIFDEDGMGCGEQSYTNGDPTEASFVKVPNEYVPQRFWDNMKKQQELQDADD